jgi:hypothetical protein
LFIFGSFLFLSFFLLLQLMFIIIKVFINSTTFVAIVIGSPGLVWTNARKLDVWGRIASNIANSHLTENLLMVLGICKSHFICGGNNGTAAATVDTSAC